MRCTVNEHYAAVLADLRVRKSKLEQELSSLDAAIGALMRLHSESPAIQGPQQPTSGGLDAILYHQGTGKLVAIEAKALGESHDRYSNIGLRWAVMWHLAEVARGWQKTGEIAKAVAAGGYKPKNETTSPLTNLVSAVLSNMRVSGEVIVSDAGGYLLSDDGRVKWGLIKQGGKFKAAISGANAQSLLSVQ